MIGLDTNVLVRYIMQDDPKQSPKANRLIDGLTAENPGFVPLVAMVELVWVLSSSYELDRSQVAQALDLLLRGKEIVIDRTDIVVLALKRFRSGSADFADCLIDAIARDAGCSETMSFDLGAVKAVGMTLVT